MTRDMKRLLIAIAVAIVAMSFLSGCVKNSGIVKVTAAPKVWAKEGLTQDQMIKESLDCQDAALAAHSSYGSYTSSAGFTEEQVKHYDKCMQDRGYTEVSD